jgi:hypothetical protein
VIVLCEPQCEGISHEKVNSGFLTLVRTAFPGEPIRLHAPRSHQQALRGILAHDGVAIDELECRDLEVHDGNTVRGVVAYHRQLARVLAETVEAGASEILFLSTSPVLLRILKRLHRRPVFASLRLVFVLHADFEDIANDTFREVPTTAVPEPALRDKLRALRPIELPQKIAAFARRRLAARYAAAFKARFRARDALLHDASDRFAYIALSPHIVANARAYVDVDALGVHVVEMPINFAPLRPAPSNDHLTLATFGYGDPGALRQVVEHLDRLGARGYEIRIIGMDNRGLESHPRVTCPSPGKRLARDEMERHAEDVDAFLILYDGTRYRLSCSGSIFEALSYNKPVLHIGNPCVVAFDSPERPIGFAHDDLAALARHVAEMAGDYAVARLELAKRRANIVAVRERLGMASLAPKLRAVLRPGASG